MPHCNKGFKKGDKGMVDVEGKANEPADKNS